MLAGHVKNVRTHQMNAQNNFENDLKRDSQKATEHPDRVIVVQLSRYKFFQTYSGEIFLATHDK